MITDFPTFENLCAQFLDGTLDIEDRERFIALLEADPANVEALRTQLMVSGALVRERPEWNDETFVHTMLAHLDSVANEDEDEFPRRVMRKIQVARVQKTVLAIAAVILLGGALFLAVPHRATSGGAVVATRFDTANGVEQTSEVRVGDKLEFKNGVSRIEFKNGAVVAVEAPASAVVRSSMEVDLDHGRLNAWCPETAHGFRVVTTSATLTDLGTSFGISAPKDGPVDFMVLEGAVTVEKDGETRKVEKGAAVQANTAEKGLENVAFEPSRFRSTWPVASGIKRTNGEVVPAPPGTPEVLAGLENDEHILVIPERRDFALQAPVRVDVTEPGIYENAKLNVRNDFNPGKKIRSYLLRYNPVGKTTDLRDYKTFKGSVTFDRPILAIICAAKKLNLSDAVLTKAPLPALDPVDANLRGLEPASQTFRSDRVELSPDRRTITVIFHAGESIDEVRAITADD